MGVFESFGLAQINDLGFDLTMLNLKSGSTCFWIVLVKKCTYSSFFRNIWWTHCQEGIINHLLYCLVPEVSCIYTWIEDEPWREKRESRINCIETRAQNELIRQMWRCDVDTREEFPITLSPEHTPNPLSLLATKTIQSCALRSSSLNLTAASLRWTVIDQPKRTNRNACCGWVEWSWMRQNP